MVDVPYPKHLKLQSIECENNYKGKDMQVIFYILDDNDNIIHEFEKITELWQMPNQTDVITFKNYEGSYKIIDRKIYYGNVTVVRMYLKRISEIVKIIDTENQYSIVRTNKSTNTNEYYDGCVKYGRDKDGVLKVNNVCWSNDATKCLKYQYRSIEDIKDFIVGMKKYDKDYDSNTYIYQIITIEKQYRVIDIESVGN